MPYRISVDTGGTFTDVVVGDDQGNQIVGKALTTPDRIFTGMKAAMEAAAGDLSLSLPELFDRTEILVYGTTRATNAIVTKSLAKTAFLTTEGFPDILVMKEGGKTDPHDFSRHYPEPFIPRRRTFEISERISAEGEVVRSLDRPQARLVVETLKARGFEAVAVCLLWSIVNPDHELAIGRLIEEIMPGVPYTLSHQLIPLVREYRRASATAIDAALKPLMQRHLREMEQDLRGAGYRGEILVGTTVGGCMHVDELIERPIHTVKSGPAMAPVAGRVYSEVEGLGGDVIICDAGGTTFDVGLVREGGLVYTRDTWLGPRWTGNLLAISSVDVRSVGAGGGSIAWIDSAGLMHVGPQSAGAVPGPACYGNGGALPTVTDAAAVLGYLDPDYFLGGRMKLDMAAAWRVISELAQQLDQSAEEAAFSVMKLANELMIRAISEITVAEGFNPAESALVAGGGAAGLNIMPIAQELGCTTIILPKTAGALSASGMQYADIIAEHAASRVTLTGDFDRAGVNRALQSIEDELKRFESVMHERGLQNARVDLFAEARYQFQVWDLDTPLPVRRFRDANDVAALVDAFHDVHERVFAVRDPGSQVECMNWKGRLTIGIGREVQPGPATPAADGLKAPAPSGRRAAYFGEGAMVSTPVYRGADLQPGQRVEGPAIVEEPTTTIVVYPNMSAHVSGAGNFILNP
jgi:N-methylhydantoinase A